MSEPDTIAISNPGVCEVQPPLPRDTRSAVEATLVTDSTFILVFPSRSIPPQTAAEDSSKSPDRERFDYLESIA